MNWINKHIYNSYIVSLNKPGKKDKSSPAEMIQGTWYMISRLLELCIKI